MLGRINTAFLSIKKGKNCTRYLTKIAYVNKVDYVLGSGQIIPDPTRPKSPRYYRIWIQISYCSYFKKDRIPSISEFLSECMRVQQNIADPQNYERLSFSVDPDPHGCPGSGSVLGMRIRMRIQEHGNGQNLQINRSLCLTKRLLYVRMYPMFSGLFKPLRKFFM